MADVTDEDVEKIKKHLKKMRDDEKDFVLKTIENFTNWLKRVLTNLYYRVRDFIDRIFDWF